MSKCCAELQKKKTYGAIQELRLLNLSLSKQEEKYYCEK